MLSTLHIENYALIRETDIRFASGFVAITGETGAGKSIMLGALGLLLGQRADTAVLADKERKCVVEALFDIHGLQLDSLLDSEDVEHDDDQLIMRREILPTGRSRSFVNDTPVSLKTMSLVAGRLLDIHSQNQTEQLSDGAFRLDLLDRLGKDTQKPRDSYSQAYHTYQHLKRQLEELTTEEAANRRDQDYLQFQYDELANARLQAGEQEELEQESQLLAHAEAVREGLAEAAAMLDDDEGQAVLARLRQAKAALTHIAAYHPSAEALLARIGTSLIELDDISSELQHTADGVTYSPERQQEVDDRLALIYRLEKKHGVDSVAALIEIRDDLDRRLQSISSLDERIHELMEQVDAAFTAMQTAAERLTASRRKAATVLAQGLLPTLHELGMPEARFEVELVAAADYRADGHDEARFLFNANRGGELSDMSRVASGGEKSRLMLAVKSMVNERRMMPTVIFDEIDTGVSGDISVAVGRIMCRMAERMQVVAITHLPQIAAAASQHLKVYKQNTADSTVSRIRQLEPGDRVTEIAVMLSSDPPTAAALQTAKELMGQ